jgi:hypothetical protein
LELNKNISEVKSDVQKLERDYASVVKKGENADISLNIVVRNLPESSNENIESKLNTLIKEGLKLTDIQVTHVIRKRAFRDTDNGVVVATCKDNEQKRKIMLAKASLQRSKKYERVFIEHDKSREERVNMSNMKTIVNTIGRDKLSIRGNRIVENQYNGYGRKSWGSTERDGAYARGHNGKHGSGSENRSGTSNGNSSGRGDAGPLGKHRYVDNRDQRRGNRNQSATNNRD